MVYNFLREPIRHNLALTLTSGFFHIITDEDYKT